MRSNGAIGSIWPYSIRSPDWVLPSRAIRRGSTPAPGRCKSPFSPLANVTLSYLAQFAAYALTLYWLGRRAGVSRLAAVYALGLFILFNLPPFNYFWGFITPYPIAPFLLVTAAAGNLILLSLIIAAEPHDPAVAGQGACGRARRPDLGHLRVRFLLHVRSADRQRFPCRPAAVLVAPTCAVRPAAPGRRCARRRIRGKRHAGLSGCLAGHLRPGWAAVLAVDHRAARARFRRDGEARVPGESAGQRWPADILVRTSGDSIAFVCHSRRRPAAAANSAVRLRCLSPGTCFSGPCC